MMARDTDDWFLLLLPSGRRRRFLSSPGVVAPTLRPFNSLPAALSSTLSSASARSFAFDTDPLLALSSQPALCLVGLVTVAAFYSAIDF